MTTIDFNDYTKPYDGRRLDTEPIFAAVDPNKPFNPVVDLSALEFSEFDDSDERLVAAYTSVPVRYLGSIALNGLLRSKNAVSKFGSSIHEKAFFDERPSHLAMFDRTRCLYARPSEPKQCCDECMRDNYQRQVRKQDYQYLEILIDPDQAVVVDQAIWDRAKSTYSDESYFSADKEVISYYARKYWMDAVVLSNFTTEVESVFDTPEVLIPFDVPPTNLRLYDPSR